MLKKIWTPMLVEEHILARVGKEPLNSYYYATHYPRVYAAAERLFGSWRDAITSCGHDYNEIRKYKACPQHGSKRHKATFCILAKLSDWLFH